MKDAERKIKQGLPFAEVPVYLRKLADALELKTADLPEELTDLPAPVGKLEIKAKARENAWELKIKIKAAPDHDGEAGVPVGENLPPADATAATAADQPPIKYKALKKRMKSTFKDIGESLEMQKLPEPGILNSFLADSDLMTAFAGEKYGERYYPEYTAACRQLAAAFEAKRWDAFKSAYAELDRMKKDCHKEFK